MRCLFLRRCVVFVVFACVSTASGQVIVPNDIYTAGGSLTIKHFTRSGSLVGSFTVPSGYGSEVRGMALGPDGLLYATIANGINGFNVVSLNSAGAVQQVYTGPEYVAGN